LKEKKASLKRDFLIGAISALGMTLVSIYSCIESTYRLLNRSIDRRQYRQEILVGGVLFWMGGLNTVVQCFLVPYHIVDGSASCCGILACHGWNRLVRISLQGGRDTWLPIPSDMRKRIYQGIGRVLLGILLLPIPYLQVMGLWIVLRFLFSALLSYLMKKIYGPAGGVDEVRVLKLEHPIVKALLTGCCKKDSIDRLVGGAISSVCANIFGPLSIYYTLLLMVVTLLCMGFWTISRLRAEVVRESTGSEDLPENMNRVQEPIWMEIINYSVLMVLSTHLS
jgi:hypothetical protein